MTSRSKIGETEHLGIQKELGYFFLVILHITICLTNSRLFAHRALELKHSKRQSVYENNPIKATHIINSLNGELIRYQKFIGFRIGKVYKLHELSLLFTILIPCTLYTLSNEGEYLLVTKSEVSIVIISDIIHYLLGLISRKLGIEATNGAKKSILQNDTSKVLTLSAKLIWSNS